MLWFCGQRGNILRIFRGWIGNWPHSPPGSAGQSSATGTCHLRNVFIFSQLLARFPPHSLRAGRGGQEREGKGHRREQKRTGDWFSRALHAKQTPWGLPNPPATCSDGTPGGSPDPGVSPWPGAQWGHTTHQGPNMPSGRHPSSHIREPRSKDANGEPS